MSSNEETYGKSYATKNEQVPVQEDDEPVEGGVNAATADSDAQLKRDEDEAIDESNIMDSRTRHAKPERGTYKEPGDTEGLPSDQ